MFSDFPNLHPLVVHLPIVLLLVSAALQALRVYRDWPPVRWITMGVMAGGFLGALAASTVFHAMPMGLAPRAAAVFEAHEKFAGYTLWLSGITLLLAGIGTYFKIERRAYEALVLVTAVATAGVLSVAGHRGAQLVYVEGVGPQGRLLDKRHGHGGGEAMPGMDMAAGQADAVPDDPNRAAAPAAPRQDQGRATPTEATMPGMDMRSQAQPAAGKSASSAGMANMDMAGRTSAGQRRPASRAEAMPDMPGMKMPASNGAQPMPRGMDVRRPATQEQMTAMPGMANMPGMGPRSAATKKRANAASGMPGMEGMGPMGNMPGMKPQANKPPQQPTPAMGNMQDMPGMSMPASPLDKFRFEDNNPARNKPTPATHQRPR